MAQLISNTFKVQIQAPRTSGEIPAWVPPAGYFADVPMLNNPKDVTPAIYANDSFGTNSHFVMWGGSAILRDFSPLSAQIYYAGGHEASKGLPNIQCSLICDFSTLLWSTANIPLAANASESFGTNGLAPDGTPYTPHSYLGLQEMPTAWGGGPQGTLVSFFWAGGPYTNRVNLLDVSLKSRGYSQLATRQSENADPTRIRFSKVTVDGGSYPVTVIDTVRQGWWASTTGQVDYTLFISKSGDIKQYPALGGNLASGAMVLCQSLNLLISIDGGYITGSGHRSMHFRDLNTGAVTRSLTLGKVPSLTAGYDGTPDIFHMPDVMGLQWVEELGCIVGFDQSVSPPVIVKLTPPSADPATASWTWSTVAVRHWPKDAAGQATLQTAQNNVWSKFRWVPSLQAFVYGTANNRKPQVIKLA
jgi:hypothetical protein